MRGAGWVAMLWAAGAPALAQEFQSEPQSVVFQGVSSVLDRNLVFPIGVNIGFIVDYIGVDLRLDASSDLAIRMEGESSLTWPDPSGEGNVRTLIEPLPNGSEIAMTSRVGFLVAFVIEVFGSRYEFNLLSQDIRFTPNVSGFEPFLLPGQQQTRVRVDADPSSGQFVIPFRFDIFDIGILGLGLGVEFRGTPITYSTVQGVGLDLLHDDDRYRITDPYFPTSITLYDNEGHVDFASEYVVDTNTVIGYRVTGEGGVDISILGQNIPIYITFLDQTFNLFTGSERATYMSGPYSHPIPTLELPIPTVDFGTVEVGDSATFTLPINNEGELDLAALIQLRGDEVFAAAPVELYAAAGGQDATILTFSPNAAGEFESTLFIGSSDPLSPIKQIPIRGVAVEPEEPANNNNGDNDDPFSDPGTTTLYSGCGCAQTPSGGPAWVSAGALALLAWRRRRS
jgi:MYXO-CTERM domain-containing protein